MIGCLPQLVGPGIGPATQVLALDREWNPRPSAARAGHLTDELHHPGREAMSLGTYVAVSCGSCNNLPPTWWLKTTDIYSLAVLEATAQQFHWNKVHKALLPPSCHLLSEPRRATESGGPGGAWPGPWAPPGETEFATASVSIPLECGQVPFSFCNFPVSGPVAVAVRRTDTP